jgi:N-acyl-L-homoserine lactone synthetase
MLLFKKTETENELKEVYKLRFKVYCQEKKFESEGEYESQYEIDEYDVYSIHFIAKVNDDIVGTARLILNNPIGFPVEKNCKLDISMDKKRSGQTAEISRLAVSKQLIKSAGHLRKGLLIGLIGEMYKESKILGIECFYAAMGRGLQRMLMNCGIIFIQNGPVVDYHGPRAPFVTWLKNIEEATIIKNINYFNAAATSNEILPRFSYLSA